MWDYSNITAANRFDCSFLAVACLMLNLLDHTGLKECIRIFDHFLPMIRKHRYLWSWYRLFQKTKIITKNILKCVVYKRQNLYTTISKCTNYFHPIESFKFNFNIGNKCNNFLKEFQRSSTILTKKNVSCRNYLLIWPMLFSKSWHY